MELFILENLQLFIKNLCGELSNDEQISEEKALLEKV